VTLSIILIQCAVNPVTGKKELMLYSEADEIAMGREVDQGIRKTYGLYDDPQLTAYVASVGRKLVPYCHRPHLKYHFAILDTAVENAFAAPGGYIYITRGLLSMMNNEAELAAVLAHELGHVNARHSMRSMSRSILFGIGLAIAGELSEDVRKFTPLAAIAGQLLFLKFSRGDEYQADSLGVDYSRKAMYNPGAMVSFFNSIQRLKVMKGGGGLPNFLSTHPLTQKRIDRVKAMLVAGDTQLARGRQPYLRKINGIVYGTNPRQGYQMGNAFYHPDMRFSFNIPQGWKIENTPASVSMAPKDGNAVIVFGAETSSKQLDVYSRENLANLSEPQFIRNRYRRINSYRAHETVFKTPDEGKMLKGKYTCIRKNGMIFSFLGFSTTNNYPNYKRAIEEVMSSFKQLNDRRHINRKPQRIKIRRVSSRQSFSEMLSRNRVPTNMWDHIGLINMMAKGETLKPGQYVKLIQ
jgi:predicted Zn-dependent protease